MIDAFPAHQQGQIRAQLAFVLQGVVTQELIPAAKGGRVMASEVLVCTPAIKSAIREGKVHQINNVIASSSNEGMMLLDTALLALHQEGIISTADALARLQDPAKIQNLIS